MFPLVTVARNKKPAVSFRRAWT